MGGKLQVEPFLERLRRAGLRVTASRRAVLEALAAADRALSLKEIFVRARAQQPGLGLATVYRTVELLQELGLIGQVRLREGCQRYFLVPPGHWHQLVCLGCGRLIHFPGRDELELLEHSLEEETGYRIEGHSLQFYGYCPEHREEAMDADAGSG